MGEHRKQLVVRAQFAQRPAVHSHRVQPSCSQQLGPETPTTDISAMMWERTLDPLAVAGVRLSRPSRLFMIRILLEQLCEHAPGGPRGELGTRYFVFAPPRGTQHKQILGMSQRRNYDLHV